MPAFAGRASGKVQLIMNNHRRNKAFTLVELLVVVLILAILVAVALPLYLDSVKTSERSACATNIKSIATGVQAWKAKNRTLSYSAFVYPTNIVGPGLDFIVAPTCPHNGTSAYTVTATTAAYRVNCTWTDHAAAGTHYIRWEDGVFYGL